MFVTVKEATEITGLSRVSIYNYIKKGIIRTDLENTKTMIKIEDCYNIRKEK